jgi:serine/threonine protein kinase
LRSLFSHAGKWLSQGGLLKLVKSYKFSAKFDEDIKNLQDGINLLNAAIAADTNLAVREGFREQEIQVEAIGARLTKHEKRVAAVLDRRDIVKEMELPKSEYTYLSDKPFAKGGSGNFVYYIEYDGVKAVAKVFPLDGLDSGDREVATSGFKKELSINYLLPENPNLVRLIGCTTSDPTKNVMIMEFVERGSLRDVLDDADTQLTTEQQLKILTGAAKGMAYMCVSRKRARACR